MSKKFKREASVVERLEKENRELKALSKSLQKRLKKVSRGYYKFIEEEALEESTEALEKVTKELNKLCWECGVGNLIKVDLGPRYFRKCNNCPRRTKSKPHAG